MLCVQLAWVVASVFLLGHTQARPARSLLDAQSVLSIRQMSLANSVNTGQSVDGVLRPVMLFNTLPVDPDTHLPHIRVPAVGCNNCLKPSLDLTPNLGEGVRMCYYWTDVRGQGNMANFTNYLPAHPQCARQVRAVEVCDSDHVPDTTLPLFGNPYSHVSQGHFVFLKPEADSFHHVQGYFLYPVEGGKQTVQIIVSLAAVPAPCPRPQGETQIVDWALFLSSNFLSTNTPGAYQVLDSGSFVLSNGLAMGKFQSTDEISIANFTGSKVMSLWVRVSFEGGEVVDSAGSGMLVIADNSEYVFSGACALTCQHCTSPTGCLNTQTCRCTCPTHWTGRNCSVCPLQCVHGTVNSQQCQCQCQGNWAGDTCNQCNIDCGAGGEINLRDCTCKCKGNWGLNTATGACSVCGVTCHNSLSTTPLPDCSCQCAPGWTGLQCDVCYRKCLHGTLNSATCQCTCDTPYWEGPECSVCNRDCAHRGSITRLHEDTCSCSDCPYPWAGQWCHVCARAPCQHGVLLNATLSSGATVRDTTTNKVSQALNPSILTCYSATVADCSCCCNSIFDTANEDSRYATTLWTGDHCEALPNYCPGGSKSTGSMTAVSMQCGPCQGNWQGRLCDKCQFQCAQGTTAGNPYCQCNCNAGWRHEAGTNSANGHCAVCEPRGASGPSCGEDEYNPAVGYSCHLGYPYNKRSGKCGVDEHLCYREEVEAAVAAGWSDATWRQFAEPNTLVAPRSVKCFEVTMANSANTAWSSDTWLYFVDVYTGKFVHYKNRHAAASGSSTVVVCLPVSVYRVHLCGGYSSNNAQLSFQVGRGGASQAAHKQLCSASPGIDYNINYVAGGMCPNVAYPECVNIKYESSFGAVDGWFTTDVSVFGSLCCSNSCSGSQYCSGFNCYGCASCGSGYFRKGCIGGNAGWCVACSSSNCVSGQSYVASRCSGGNNGCVDSGCANTGCH